MQNTSSAVMAQHTEGESRQLHSTALGGSGAHGKDVGQRQGTRGHLPGAGIGLRGGRDRT
jgi:hypothetical protein